MIFHIMTKIDETRNHHSLAIASFKDKNFMYIDSLQSQGRSEINNAKAFYMNFVQFLKSKGQPADNWTFECPTHILQRNNYSCGLKVIGHFKQFILNGTFKYKQSTEMIERAEMCKFILENSIDMHTKCVVCCENAENDCLKCCYCLRLYHNTCVEKKVFNDTLDKCPLCVKFLSE